MPACSGDDGEMYHGFPKYYPEKTTPLPTEDEMEALSKVRKDPES